MAGTITHEWVGTTLVITSDSGSSGCDLKGDRGDIGIRGPQGPQGEKPEVFFTVGIEDETVLDTEWKELNVNGTRVLESINLHTSDMNNPHGITCEQIGADVVGSAAAVQGQLLAHIEETNPHNTTPASIGLGNVDNTADIDKPVSTAQQEAINVVKSLVDVNTETINSMNDVSTGLLAQAKAYTDEQVASGGGGSADVDLSNYYTKEEVDTNTMAKAGGTFTNAVYAMSGSTTTPQLRNTGLYATATNPTVNGQINWTYG